MSNRDELNQAALEYHEFPKPGKVEVAPIKPLSNQRDLALAYSPGVAAACNAIVADPMAASRMTIRANLVAVVTNGTAVLGLGNIGPLAGKPVMEGKGVLFKKFAGIDVFDIELAENDPDKLIDMVAALEPTFGGINLEDIKAPECFYIERKLKERMKIPVFHDDQHGTAIIVGAAVLNGLKLVGKDIGKVKVVTSGAGAAALACLDLLVSVGVKRDNIWVTDVKGVVYQGRKEEMDDNKVRYAQDTPARTLGDIMDGADIFLGLSAGRVLKAEMVKKMAKDPLILALANPIPEIMPEEAKAARPDAIIATGRSDYHNQVNNVLCFPFIFRGALDVGATAINEEMKLAVVHALAELTRAEASDVVTTAYHEELSFGPEYLIPRPFDPRLITKIAPAVAKAAMDSGVATRPIADLEEYRRHLNEYVFRTTLVMTPVFAAAKKAPKHILYAEGEEQHVLQAVQVVVDEGLARPILIGRREVIQDRIGRLGLRLRLDTDVEVVNQDSDPRYREICTLYHSLMERRGISPDAARRIVRANTTVIGALLLRRGDADGMICGTVGAYHNHLRHVLDVIGLRPRVDIAAAMNLMTVPTLGEIAVCDTHVNCDPSAEDLAGIAVLAAEEMRRFGIGPKVALLSHSNFGSADSASAYKMRTALRLIREQAPELEVEGEMHVDSALSEDIRTNLFPNSRLKGKANLWVMPNLDAANITYNTLKMVSGNIAIGPILLGAERPVHILTPTTTVRRIVNMTALTVVDAQAKRG
ncbi:MAG: NADP-dependent malic enzyme [Betaproteobacteria bacterium]|nr:NADP-dependent malic enzyme [Betaproteobacteria bacterium]